MLVRKAAVLAAVLLALTVPSTSSAQSVDGPSIHVFGQVGTAVALRDLNTPGTATLQSPVIAFGGGVGMQFNENIALRGYLDYSPTEGEGATSPVLGDAFSRYYYGVDAQFRLPTESGVAPFFGIGLGGTTITNDDNDDFSHTGLTAKGVLGVGYVPDNSNIEYFAQSATYLYNYRAATFDRTQADMLWTVGLKYSFAR